MNDVELEKALELCVAREREAITEVLKYLREVEERQLFLARGYSSLFAYCTKRLKYSESDAMLRIQAMRLTVSVPGVMEKIESGGLSMSVAAQIQSAARREKLPEQETKELVADLSGASKREAEKKLAELFPEAPRPEKCRPVSEDLVEIRFTVTKEEAALLQELMNRKAHKNFDRRFDKLFMGMAREELKKYAKKEAPPQGPDKVTKTRYIPVNLRRHIWRRDRGICQYKDPLTGKVCGERHGVQIDHRKPYAEGGSHAPENLRLLCGAHNRWRDSRLS